MGDDAGGSGVVSARAGTSARPPLLLIAHGTRSADGLRTLTDLMAAVADRRPDLACSLCFLDVGRPTLAQVVPAVAGTTIAVPLLLATGYHVQTDIPALAGGNRQLRLAEHLGPHPLVADALVDRLPPGRFASTVLVSAGSSRAEAGQETAQLAVHLGARLDTVVHTATVGSDLRATLQSMPAPTRVATHLIAPGRFTDQVHDAARELATVAAPIGVHPALIDLVWLRYDEALARDTAERARASGLR